MILSDLFLLSLVFVAGYAIWHNAQFRDIALRHTRRYCEQQGIQLLDDSMVIRQIRPCRHHQGWLQLQRTYEFEFTASGAYRHRGTTVLQGRTPKNVVLPVFPVD